MSHYKRIAYLVLVLAIISICVRRLSKPIQSTELFAALEKHLPLLDGAGSTVEVHPNV